jgi:hypothetical protein
MPDGFTTDCKAAVLESGGKDLEEMDRVGDVAERGVLTEGEAESGPNTPGIMAPIAVSSSDAGEGHCL